MKPIFADAIEAPKPYYTHTTQEPLPGVTEEYRQDVEPAGELSSMLSQCETECELKPVVENIPTVEELRLIQFIESYQVPGNGIDQHGIEYYMKDRAINFYNENVNYEFFETEEGSFISVGDKVIKL